MRLSPEEEQIIRENISRKEDMELKRREDSLKRLLKKARNRKRV